jgi:F-type H+-transporting ATPase subunit b
MLALIARWVYPWVLRAAEARQKQVADQLAAAEGARKEAERQLAEANRRAHDAQAEASQLIEAAKKSGERIQQQAQQTAEANTHRIVELTKKEIDAERQRAIQDIREEAADLVVAATRVVLVQTLDEQRHRRLIDQVISRVSEGQTTS